MIEYQEHPEAKSLAPDGSECQAETSGLLKRAHILAGEIRYVGKETHRKWEESDDVLWSSLLPNMADQRE